MTKVILGGSVFHPLRFATRLLSISIECPYPLMSYYHPGTISDRGFPRSRDQLATLVDTLSICCTLYPDLEIFYYHPGTVNHRGFPKSRDQLRFARRHAYYLSVHFTLAYGYLHIIPALSLLVPYTLASRYLTIILELSLLEAHA